MPARRRSRRNAPRRRRRGRSVWLLLLALAAGGWLLLHPEALRRLFVRRPNAIIIHHSASPPVVDGRRVDAAAIDAMHARRGFGVLYQGKTYHIGYHYVILPDGTVQSGRPEGCVGAHARHINGRALGICLVGDFASADNPDGRKGPTRPSGAQLQALVKVCAGLARRYGIPVENVRPHRAVGHTACPGDRFPFAAFLADLRRELERPSGP